MCFFHLKIELWKNYVVDHERSVSDRPSEKIKIMNYSIMKWCVMKRGIKCLLNQIINWTWLIPKGTLSAMLAKWPNWWQCLVVGLHLGPDWNILMTIGWIAVTFGSNIHEPQRMNRNDFDDPLTCPLASTQGWHLWFSVKILQTLLNEMPAQLLVFFFFFFFFIKCPLDKLFMSLLIHSPKTVPWGKNEVLWA